LLNEKQQVMTEKDKVLTNTEQIAAWALCGSLQRSFEWRLEARKPIVPPDNGKINNLTAKKVLQRRFRRGIKK